MEEHFILRVPSSVAVRLNSVLSDNPEFLEDESIDLSFQEDGRTGTFVIGEDEFEVSLVDLPCVVESYKTYDDTLLIKSADIGQMILVKELDEDATKIDGVEYTDGITPAMRDARRRRFRKEPFINPDYVQQVENDLQSILAGGNAKDIAIHVEVVEQEEDYDDEEDAQAEQVAAVTPGAQTQPEPITCAANAAAAPQDDEDTSDDENQYYVDSDDY